MSQRLLPRYPIYVPSKGRHESIYTARFLKKDGVPFFMVVEEAEAEDYARAVGEEHLLVLPFSDQGSVIPARNWIKRHATDAGFERHWQLDDNIVDVKRLYRGKRVKCPAGWALRLSEDFVERYENVAVAGLNYAMFAHEKYTPFMRNCHVYSCSLTLNSLPYEWRGTYNEDTDYCLQVLAGGWCTILFNAFLVEKIASMVMKGGNTQELYDATDGRLKMARALERVWPGVVTTKRRFNRPQHVVADRWSKFDTPLIKKKGLKIKPGTDERGLKLRAVRKIKSPRIQKLLDEAGS